VAICGRPRLLFLDEPTASLDVQAREVMWTTLRRLVAQRVSVVLTTHHLEEAEQLAHRVAVLARGQLVALGGVQEIRALVTLARIDCVTILDVEDVASWPNVSSVTRDERGLHIATTHCVEAVVRRLLLADDCLTGLEVRRAGLNEALAHLAAETAS
jgi:ABC-2 type transport system ATP-binding protein